MMHKTESDMSTDSTPLHYCAECLCHLHLFVLRGHECELLNDMLEDGCRISWFLTLIMTIIIKSTLCFTQYHFKLL